VTATATGGDLLDRVREIGPVLAAGVAEGERERRLPEPTVRAVDDAGLTRLWTQRRYGGLEADVRALSLVTRELARHCPSTAWVVNNVNGSNLLAARFPRAAQDEVFAADPGVRLASVFVAPGTAVAVPGGYRISGSWPYATGIRHDRWAVLLAREPGAEGGLSVLLPVAELTVLDTWHTVGMRATGSHTVRADDVFVPAHRVISSAEQLNRDNATDRTRPPLLRTAAVAAMAVICASVVLGAAQAGLAHVVEQAPGRAIAASRYSRATGSPAFVAALGGTALRLDAAELHLDRAAGVLDAAAAAAEGVPEAELRRIRADVGQVVRLATTALDELLWAHGAGAFAETSPLQRFWRDANTAARHAVLNPLVSRELYGGAFFGLDPVVPGL
jgi:3-hydroxy-9,10-secoandrosta-1,3,5(10)-triene-9,17-dione monooxygenase